MVENDVRQLVGDREDDAVPTAQFQQRGKIAPRRRTTNPFRCLGILHKGRDTSPYALFPQLVEELVAVGDVNRIQPAGRDAVRVLRCGVWVGAGVAIVVPGLVQATAELLGIGRGADVVLYLSVLAFMWAAFFLYARCLRLEREITALTRHLAIRDAVRGRAGQESARPVGG